MKRYICILLCVLCLGLAACQNLPDEPKASPAPEATEERPPAPEFSLCLYLEDGNTRLLPLTTEANEALRDLIETADAAVDCAEGDADLIFVNDRTTIYLNSGKGILTVVEGKTEQGVSFLSQANYRLTKTLDTAILPEWDEPQEKDTILTLQDLVDQADLTLLDAEGSLLETIPYEGTVPVSAGNRCTAALNEDGSVILRAQKLDLTGRYEAMTIQEVKFVDGTLIVSAAVLSEEGSAVTVTPPEAIRQVWFLESGAFMDIILLDGAK